MKILVINGPNLNLLGQRENYHYGELTLQEIEKKIINEFPDDTFEFFQSNLEGEIINKIQECSEKFDGLIINPGGYSHSSIAIRDALEICQLTKIEVHLSNLTSREDFRKSMITSAACDGIVSGFKGNSYLGGIYLLKKIFEESN
ncbi:MAG: 3-dehydroquinate dehydratase [Ignavibacteria bacterium RBG_13_36_8]|nr:MAG: 3-dehydroquinate dehydratase [Ignavibacteria bacterium RBG_13_36_8]